MKMLSKFLSKYDELSSSTLCRPTFMNITQQINKNRRLLFILFTTVTLGTLLVATNQHETIIASLPTISISRSKPIQETKDVPTANEDILTFPKFMPALASTADNETSFISDSLAPKYSLSDNDITRLLELPLSERLQLIFPYETTPGLIPKNIFQQHKSRNLQDLGSDLTRYINSFKEANAGENFTHYLYDDALIERFVIKEFGLLFPELIRLYHGFPKRILRYDFFRYLVIYIYGGTYADTDTVASKPISEWLSYNATVYGDVNSIGAVVGPEGECDCQDWEKLEGRRIQFCQWAFQFKAHHPILRQAILKIYENYSRKYDKGNKIFTAYDGKQYDFNKEAKEYLDGVIEFTGPTMFTDALYEYLNSLDPLTFHINSPNNHQEIWAKLRAPKPNLTKHSYVWEHDININVGWENFTNIMEPLVINKDVMILPRFYFNPRFHEQAPEDQYWVRHNYHGDWKNSKD